MKEIRSKIFVNGLVHALETFDGYPVETTDTFLPYYTKDAATFHENRMKDGHYGSRYDRWMIGISCMSGCPVGCKFCATGQLKRWRPLTDTEMVEQVLFVLDGNVAKPTQAKEFKINYTRMGEPFLNIENVRNAKDHITSQLPFTHHYISTIGIRGSDFSWIEGNTTLQISLHSLDEDRRSELIPITGLMTIEELGKIRTRSNQKTTLNLTLVDQADFDIDKLRKHFDPEHFFIKLSPINPNCVSEANGMGAGVIT